jgi:hypothetical protein
VTFRFHAAIWLHPGNAGWHFLTVPDDVSDEIDFLSGETTRGFGSVRVEATIGSTTWRTSVFPDTRRGAYLLPVNKAVRRAEDLSDGSPVEVELALVDG